VRPASERHPRGPQNRTNTGVRRAASAYPSAWPHRSLACVYPGSPATSAALASNESRMLVSRALGTGASLRGSNRRVTRAVGRSRYGGSPTASHSAPDMPLSPAFPFGFGFGGRLRAASQQLGPGRTEFNLGTISVPLVGCSACQPAVLHPAVASSANSLSLVSAEADAAC
jgi:hypothetical protein